MLEDVPNDISYVLVEVESTNELSSDPFCFKNLVKIINSNAYIY